MLPGITLDMGKLKSLGKFVTLNKYPFLIIDNFYVKNFDFLDVYLRGTYYLVASFMANTNTQSTITG